jgi:formylglycine-generating enzyme required for sulfatase activity
MISKLGTAGDPSMPVALGVFAHPDDMEFVAAGTLTVSVYEIDRTPVTVAAYRRCIVEGRCSLGDSSAINWSRETEYPIVGVTWDQADQYCTWAGARLPTEAVWKEAARGTDGRRYAWGQELPANEKLVYGPRAHVRSSPVRTVSSTWDPRSTSGSRTAWYPGGTPDIEKGRGSTSNEP